MKILSQKLRGFTGIRRGMGIDEISLDLSGLNGLIAFSGKNGAGKSTLLENLSPYRTLASRSGTLARHCFLRDSEKHLSFMLNGDEYRTLVKIDAESDRQEAFVWRNGVPQVDGKVRSFDRYLVDLLGSPELFFSSVFAAQGSKKISDLTTGELKKLFSEFLRLHVLEQHEATSKQAVNSISLITSRILQDIAGLNGVADEIQRHRAALEEADNSLVKSVALRLDMKQDVYSADQAVTEAAEAVNRNAVLAAQLSETRKQITAAQTEYDRLKTEAETAMQALKDAHGAKLAEAQNLKAVLAEEPKIRAAVEAVTRNEIIAAKVTDLKARLAAMQADYDREKGEYENKSGALKTQYLTLKHEIDSLKKLLENESGIRKAAQDEKEASELYRQTSEKMTAEQETVTLLTDTAHALEMEHRDKSRTEDKLADDLRAKAKEKSVSVIDLGREVDRVMNDKELFRLESEVRDCHRRAEERKGFFYTIGTVCPSTTCAAVKGAIDAEQRLPELEASLTAKQDEILLRVKAIREVIARAEAEFNSLNEQAGTAEKHGSAAQTKRKAEIVKIQSDLQIARGRLAGLKESAIGYMEAQRKAADLAANLPEIDQARGKLSPAETRLSEITADGIALRDAWTKREETLGLAIFDLTRDIRIESEKISLWAPELAARLPEIEKAAASIPQVEARIAELATEGAAARQKWEARDKDLTANIQSMESLSRDQEGKIDLEADGKLVAARESAEKVRASIANLEKEIAGTETRIAGIQRDIQEAEKKLARKVELETEKARRDRDTSEWIYLREACGAKGLRALEIDAVVPAIMYETNELLSYSDFGTLKIYTQDPETGKEVFWIKIIDKEGEEVQLDWRSGGEQIWPIQALRLGMTLVSKQKSNYDYRTAFSDELDGALDVENAKRFVSLYPNFMKRGEFENLYFISHKPDCTDMADHQLVFHDGGISIE